MMVVESAGNYEENYPLGGYGNGPGGRTATCSAHRSKAVPSSETGGLKAITATF